MVLGFEPRAHVTAFQLALSVSSVFFLGFHSGAQGGLKTKIFLLQSLTVGFQACLCMNIHTYIDPYIHILVSIHEFARVWRPEENLSCCSVDTIHIAFLVTYLFVFKAVPFTDWELA